MGRRRGRRRDRVERAAGVGAAGERARKGGGGGQEQSVLVLRQASAISREDEGGEDERPRTASRTYWSSAAFSRFFIESLPWPDGMPSELRAVQRERVSEGCEAAGRGRDDAAGAPAGGREGESAGLGAGDVEGAGGGEHGVLEWW